MLENKKPETWHLPNPIRTKWRLLLFIPVIAIATLAVSSYLQIGSVPIGPKFDTGHSLSRENLANVGQLPLNA